MQTCLGWLDISALHQWPFHLLIKTGRLGTAQWQSSQNEAVAESHHGGKSEAALQNHLERSWTLDLLKAL